MSLLVSFKINKNIILPLAIILVSIVIGGAVLVWGNSAPTNEQTTTASNNLRSLELSVPDMFCAGCTASVEGYVSAMPGVKRVQARLVPTKSATVVYDPTLTTKEEIIKNQIFNLYGVSIISDNFFTGSVLPTASQEGLIVPQEIQNKSKQAVLLLQQKSDEEKDISTSQSLFNQVNSNIELGNFTNADALLDTIITLLQNL